MASLACLLPVDPRPQRFELTAPTRQSPGIYDDWHICAMDMVRSFYRSTWTPNGLSMDRLGWVNHRGPSSAM